VALITYIHINGVSDFVVALDVCLTSGLTGANKASRRRVTGLSLNKTKAQVDDLIYLDVKSLG
jgi:hypothetical protein